VVDVRKHKAFPAGPGGFPGDWDVYPSHHEYVEMMLGFQASHPDICRLDTIGQSVAGREILVIKITDQPDIREPEPAFYYTSTMHGNETTGYVILLRLIDHILGNYGNDPLVTRLVDNIEIWINPLANPDATYWLGDDEISMPKRFNLNGADLNRNFPGIKDNPHPDNMDYQPENLAQMHFMDSIYLVLSANVHDGEEVFNYPWDSWEGYHADDEWFRWAGHKYADTAQQRSYPVLYMSGFNDGITIGWQWYKIEGSRQDYVTYYLHAREVTLEISLERAPPPTDLPFFWHYNHPSMLQFMENSLFGIQGMVTDSLTGKPVEAVVRVLDHDRDSSYIFTDKATGYFARLIEPGRWDLEVSSSGYGTKIIRDVEVDNDLAAHISIQLDPAPLSTQVPQHLDVSPNPFIYNTLLSYSVIVPGRHKIRLFDMHGRLRLEDQLIHDLPGMYTYRLDGKELEEGIYILQFISPESTVSGKIFKSQ
jgi:hypothetical protein